MNESLDNIAASDTAPSLFDQQSEPALPLVRIAGAGITAALATFSVCANLLLILVFRKFNPGDSLAFYRINWQLVFGDLANQMFCQLLLAVPITFAGQAIYGNGPVLRLLGLLDTLSYSSTLFFSALMTLNRATVFLAPRLNNSLFKANRIFVPIAAVWLYSAAIALALDLGGCPKLFSEKGLFLSFVCSEETVSPLIWAIRQYYRFVPNVLPALMLLVYLALFCFLKCNDTTTRLRSAGVVNAEFERQRYRMERSLLVQSFLICGMLELEDLAFNFILTSPSHSGAGQWPYVVNICSNWLMLLLNSMTALILFCFNTQFRAIAKQLLAKCFKCAVRPNGHDQGGPILVIRQQNVPQRQVNNTPLTTVLKPPASRNVSSGMMESSQISYNNNNGKRKPFTQQSRQEIGQT